MCQMMSGICTWSSAWFVITGGETSPRQKSWKRTEGLSQATTQKLPKLSGISASIGGRPSSNEVYVSPSSTILKRVGSDEGDRRSDIEEKMSMMIGKRLRWVNMRHLVDYDWGLSTSRFFIARKAYEAALFLSDRLFVGCRNVHTSNEITESIVRLEE